MADDLVMRNLPAMSGMIRIPGGTFRWDRTGIMRRRRRRIASRSMASGSMRRR